VGIIGGSFAFTLDQMGLYFFGLKWPFHCVLNHLFGVKCAFCGMTRSFTAMADGDIRSAFEYHRCGPVLFGYIVFQIPYRIWAIAISPRRVKAGVRKVNHVLAAVVAAAIFINWLIYFGGRIL